MKKIIKFWDKIIVVLLGVLGISVAFHSCMKTEYGVPHADYEIKGIVTNKETSKPIQNIQVVHQRYHDTTYTNSDGKYTFIYNSNLLDGLHLVVEDIDGEANGGEFDTKEIDIKITQADQVKKGKENWDWGKYVKTVNIELETKK